MVASRRSALALVARFARAPALAVLVIGLWTGAATAQTPAQAPAGPPPQIVQLPDGSYVIILPPQNAAPPGVPPSYASPPPAYEQPRAPIPEAAYPPQPGYAPQQLPSGTPYAQRGYMSARGYATRDDVLARIGTRLHRERTALVVGTAAAAVFALGAVFVSTDDGFGTSTDGTFGHSGGAGGRGGVGIALMVLGAGAGFGGFTTSSIAGLRTSRDFALLGAPNGRGTAITSIVALALVETSPLAIPLGWLHYGRARRHYAMLTGGQSRATLELSIRPMLDPATGLRGAAVGGSF